MPGAVAGGPGAAAVEEAGGEVVVFPLSFPQQRLWLLDRMEPGSPAYNLPSALRARGPLEPAALERALAAIVARHESLRTRFGVVDGEPAQLVHPPGSFVLPLADLSALPAGAREAEARRQASREGRTPFDLERGPLLRAALLRLDAEEHLLLLTLHHIVSDGWSTGVLLRELSALYRAFRDGRPSPLPELPIQYGDYAVWQREELEGETLEAQAAFWRRELAGAPPLLDLPADRPRPPVRGGPGAKHSVAVPVDVAGRLAALGRERGATLFMTLLAASAVLLGRYADQDEVVLGTPIAGRTQEELEGLIGFFVNTLAVRVDLAGDPSFAEVLDRARRRLLDAFAHQEVPFERVVEELRVPRDPGRTPVFQAMFVLQGGGAGGDGPAEEPRWTPEPAGTGTAKFDLTLVFVEHEGGLAAVLDYDAALFDAATVERMGDHLLRLLGAVAADPGRRLSELPVLSPDEERRLLAESRGPRRDYPEAPAHRLFLEQARRTPAAVAAVFPDAEVTYAELEARSAGVARRLRAEGVGPETRVALLAGRSPEMLAGLLGILRAGGAYVPLDPSAPPERTRAILRDSGALALLAEPRLAGRAAGFTGTVLPLDGALSGPSGDAPDAAVPPEALAYVIYTSGSTGAPKGVMVPHRALANLVHVEVELHGFGPDTRLLAAPPVSFDAAAGDVFPLLACGGRLVFHPAPGELSGPEALRFAREHGVNAGGIPVALWSHWLEGLERGWDGEPLPLPPVTRVGGESLPLERARAWRRLGGGRSRLFNHYGPTEATVIVTVHAADDLAGRETVSGSVPIGRPVPGAAAYVLDRHLRPVPTGVAGELFAGGVQVARGYLGRPELTAERFVPDPFSAEPGARMYRTGDRVRRLPDGALEFLGRNDAQLKVRGFRVEPAEVEAALLEHPAVREAAVAARPDSAGEARLVAWFVAGGEGADPAALRRHLRARLPDYMVPSALVPVEALPLTANGKVDRGALPEPPAGPAGARAYRAPRTPTERALAEVWAETLGLERVGADDDFFDLGGHSLAAARAAARVQERTGRDLPLGELFRGATPERLARLLDEDGAGAPPPGALLRLRDGTGAPLFCVPAAGGMGAAYLRLARRLDDRPVYALQARGLAPGERPDATVEEAAARYLEAVRAARPRGPYLLAGWSAGGAVAFEMARRLRSAGEEVALLALIDSWAPLDGTRPPAPDHAGLLLLLAADLGARAEPAALAALGDELRPLPGDARLARFEAWIHRVAPDAPEMDGAGLRRRLAVYRAAADAAAAYRPAPYPGRVTLFRALASHAWETDPRLRWRELTPEPLDVHDVQGSHHSLVVGADVENLAAALRGVLASASPS